MEPQTVILEVPPHLYTELQVIAKREHMDVIGVITQLVKQSRQKNTIQNDWYTLCALVNEQGGLDVGDTTEEIVERLRETRQALVEEEYAHLYR